MFDLAQDSYLLTAALFIVGIMRLRSPRTARSGNLLAAAGMLIAIVTALSGSESANRLVIAIAIAIGVVAGTVMARLVRMTAMPQMVALFNGMGGGAAALVAAGSLLHEFPVRGLLVVGPTIAALFSLIVGSISLLGSALAFAKLQELMTTRPLTFPMQQVINAGLGALLLLGAVWFSAIAPSQLILGLLMLGALALGGLVVLPVGGADMPVIISLLNSFTGLAAAASGFVVGNNALIIGGALVGASGTILTLLMSQAMNRSLANVLFGAFGSAAGTAVAASTTQGTVRSTSADDVATLLAYSSRVIIVPGYGLAVARAQQETRDLADMLAKRGVDVAYAIHPVAGRMPGHMNVLLAEANVPYTQLFDLDEINPRFATADVALIIGANDVTNPAARSDASSPIYGMPILNVDHARNVIVLKRSMHTGFAGVDNPLYYLPKTMMLFGDARESIVKLAAALKQA